MDPTSEMEQNTGIIADYDLQVGEVLFVAINLIECECQMRHAPQVGRSIADLERNWKQLRSILSEIATAHHIAGVGPAYLFLQVYFFGRPEEELVIQHQQFRLRSRCQVG